MNTASDLLDDLQFLPWSDLMPELLSYALMRTGSRIWQGVRGRGVAAARADDVVGSALTRVFEGRRKWNRTRYPDIRHFLKSVIDSEISHLARSASNRRERPLATLNEGDGRAYGTAVDPAADIERALVEDDEEEAARFFVLRFHDALADDPLLQRLFDLLEKDACKRRHLAQALKIPVEAVDNARKRLARRYLHFLAQDPPKTRGSRGR